MRANFLDKKLLILLSSFLIGGLLLASVLVHPAISQSTTSQSTQPLPFTIATYGNAWNGELAFGVGNNSDGSGPSYLVVMKTDGTIEYLLESTNYSFPNFEVAKNIAQNTLLTQYNVVPGGSSSSVLLQAHILNYVTNTSVDYPNVYGHHEIDYDPINNTFLTFQEYTKTVNNNTYLFDKIVQLNATGSILWSWDTYDHIPLSEADPYNLTATINGETVIDFTHSNCLDWDYNNSIIYLNCRHTNTFYKIDQNTGNIIWACGQFGNFTLISENGTAVNSLWWHSHGTTQVAPDVFAMFDNDFDNETNPDDCQSRMIEVTLNETSMKAYVSWEWVAPKSYWSLALGYVARLPNGDRLGTFGMGTHQAAQNQPWDFNDTGAIIAEVNSTGSLVRTWTFPVGWYIYRAQPIIYSSTFPSPTPTPIATTPAPTNPPPTSTPTQTTPTPTVSVSPTVSPSTSPNVSASPTISPTVPTFPEKTLALMVTLIMATTTASALIFRARKKAQANNNPS